MIDSMQGQGGPDSTDSHVAQLYRDGYTVIRSALDRYTAHALAGIAEGCYKSAVGARPEEDLVRGGVSLMRVFEQHRAFRDLLTLEPAASIADAVLGDDCHVISQNLLRTPRGKGIVKWHIDDALFLPFLGDYPVPAERVPVFALNVMLLLSDTEEDRFGPTQVVPGSHLRGYRPPYLDEAQEGMVSLNGRAGDCYLINSQTWHRGVQNLSDRTRYLLTTAYGRRCISQRFYPFVHYQLPGHVLKEADPRTRRLLGEHDKGPYG